MITSLFSTRGVALFSTLVASLGLLSACGSTVNGGGSGGSGGAGEGGASNGPTATSVGPGGTSGSVGPGGTSGSAGVGGFGPGGEAIAMLYSQFPPPSMGSTTGNTTVASSSSGGGVDPNTLYIFMGDHHMACSDPFQLGCPQWQVTIGIPPALQAPGVIQLSDMSVISTASFSNEPDSNGECSAGGGGSFINGTLEIVSIDASMVVGKLDNTDTFEFDANGSFTALRCP